MAVKPKWDIATLRAVIGVVHLVRTQSPVPQKPLKSKAARERHLIAFGSWDDCCEVLDRALRKMTEVR